MGSGSAAKQKYSILTLKQAMQLVPATDFISWNLNAPPRPPSDHLLANLRSLESFDLQTTEEAKTLLIDDLLREIVPAYPKLKVWKAAPLESDTLKGVADYLVTPKKAYIETPLLCVVEAKKDDFVKGAAQCVAEMVACRSNNQQSGYAMDVFGIVSNGQDWKFYKLTQAGEIFETSPYDRTYLPELLGALDTICAECANNVP